MRFNFLVLCTTFVHTWTLGNGYCEQHTVWMGSWVSMPSSENSSVVGGCLDSFKVDGHIYAGVNIITYPPTPAHHHGTPQVLTSPTSRPTPRGVRLLRSSPTSRRALQVDPVEQVTAEVINHKWFVEGYHHSGLLCNDGSVDNVKLDGAIHMPSLVFYTDGKDSSKHLTLFDVKFGFQLGSYRTWFISRDCSPRNPDQGTHFSCCIATDQLDYAHEMMVYAPGPDDRGSGTAAYFAIRTAEYGAWIPDPLQHSEWGCQQGAPTHIGAARRGPPLKFYNRTKK
mmetsp:Transcript_2608/g.4013  ORF Transcript_2608/g.4013 Transcript_2608/m.4013 type:complete len:282 (-) Transcript_2608:35-880(-)